MPTLSEGLPALPRWQLAKEGRRAKDIFDEHLAKWLGAVLGDQVLLAVVESLADSMDLWSPAAFGALTDTLCQDIDQQLTAEHLRRLAFQLAVNRQQLVDGKPLLRFANVREAQWVPFHVASIADCQFGSRAGIELRLLVIGAQYAGHTASKKVPLRFCAKIAYDIGFNRRTRYDSPEDLVGLQFAGYLTPTSEPELQFEHYTANSSMQASNRATIKARQ